MPPKASTSGAGPKAKAGGGKLSPIEQKLLDVGSQAPNREIGQQELMIQCGLSISPSVQDAVNGLLRKNLMQMLRTQSGQIMFRFLKKEEAKAIGAMDSEEKLVLDYIKDAGNLGIWTKTLTTKTGLARTTMTKVLKILEGRKSIKTVKSVKFPTRKIYMLAGLQPSVELTGGPWFTDNELDTELVDTLKKVVQKHLQDHSIPKSQTYHPPDDPMSTIRYRPIYPVSATPFLPGIESILEYISKTEVIQVDLQPKHVEALMDLMVYDGIVEKVFIGNSDDRSRKRAEANQNGNGTSKLKKDKKGKRKKIDVGSSSSESSDSDDDDSDDDGSRKKKKSKKGKKGTVKRGKNGKAKKKRSKTEDSDDDDSSESDFDEDAPAKSKKKRRRGSDDSGASASEDDDNQDDSDEDSDDGGSRKKKKKASQRKKKDRSKKKLKALASDEEDSDDDPFKLGSDQEDVKPKLDYEHAIDDHQNLNDYVYRLVRPYTPVIGWTDMPCGKCPVEEFCSEPLRQRAGVVKRPTTVSDSYPDLSLLEGGGPKLKIELEGGIQGVGMLGGAGAAIGVSLAKWGEMKGSVGKGVAPVNPRDCVYFKDWLTVDPGHDE
ncbi:uncharacterized protein JCM15063_004086 [Sporobolomyces koalae]|uniref:uncharacterized protein n=1 Tax=Sporobolomyces koalae TaxID=500713 RepID=UPI00316FD04D